MPGMLWSATLYSPLSHARITQIDAAAARRMPGVHAVLTGARARRRAVGPPHPRLAAPGARPRALHRRPRGSRGGGIAGHRQSRRYRPSTSSTRSCQRSSIRWKRCARRADPARRRRRATRCSARARARRAAHPNVQGTQAVHKDDADIDAVFAQRAPRLRAHLHDAARAPGLHRAARPACCGSTSSDVVHVVCTNKMPFGLRDQLVTVAGRRRTRSRRRRQLRRRRLRRQGPGLQRAAELLPGARHGPTDQVGHELRRVADRRTTRGTART